MYECWMGSGMKEESAVKDERGERKHLILPPDVEVKGDVRLDLQFVCVRWLKYTLVCAVIVFDQLAVQKPGGKEIGC